MQLGWPEDWNKCDGEYGVDMATEGKQRLMQAEGSWTRTFKKRACQTLTDAAPQEKQRRHSQGSKGQDHRHPWIDIQAELLPSGMHCIRHHLEARGEPRHASWGLPVLKWSMQHNEEGGGRCNTIGASAGPDGSTDVKWILRRRLHYMYFAWARGACLLVSWVHRPHSSTALVGSAAQNESTLM